MWVLTDVANWYDKQRKDNATWLESVMDHASYDFLGAVVYTLAGAGYVLNGLPGAFAGGFVDVLRLGDGVKEGGWGYGKDALRLLIVAGPALRLARYGLVMVAVVDETPAVGNCLWVQGAQALRLTGTRHFARVADLAGAAGIAVTETGGGSTSWMLPLLRTLGADARSAGTVVSFEEVANLARSNPNGIVIFGVRFARSNGAYLANEGHALIARSVGGTVFIFDRSGKVYSSLKELAVLYGAAPEMGLTIFAQEAPLVVNNARIVGLANAVSNAAWLANAIGLELRSVPGPRFGQAAPLVLLTDTQLLTGWWWIWVDQFLWCYRFESHGAVHWSDPYNHRYGSGKWKAVTGAIEASWPSSTKERWNLPIMTGQQTGTYVGSGKTSSLKAMKIPAETWAPLVGKWQVKVSKWTWNYSFTASGRVTWVDPFNGQTGSGTWAFTKASVYITWANSATREEWNLPISPANQTGECRMSAGLFPVSAAKTG